MRVFISHSSKDKAAVERLALGLRERGIEPWLDKWEIGPGDDIAAGINAGLEAANAGLIVFSRHSLESRWVEAEISYLTFARIEEGKILVPVVVGTDSYVPPLLRPLARRAIEETDAIADALLGRKPKPPAQPVPGHGRTERVVISLRRENGAGFRVTVWIGREKHGEKLHALLPAPLLEARDWFLRGLRFGPYRSAAAANRAALEASLADLGRHLRGLCFPDGTGEAVAELVDGSPLGTSVEVLCEADDPVLLGLPFEALRLPDDRLLAVQDAVVMLRRPVELPAHQAHPLAGPLKILVAVAAPDEAYTSAAVLDQERELQNILDAVEPAQRHENVEVRILEVGHPEVIAAAVAADAYHVLHLSCHGMPGALEFEDEDGRAVSTTAADLIGPLRRAGRPLPLVLLSACHGGVHQGMTASFAEQLLRAGVPGVLAMQTTVSDFYATQLARLFYHHLASRELLLASRALAAARRELEDIRREAVQRGAPLAETQPEYATATLFVADREVPLADFALEKQPLRVTPVHEMAGPVPQLRIDDLIGRRRELRETLRALRDAGRRQVGVMLTGIGGIGKSAVAGRAMQRLAEDHWLVAAYAGLFNLAGIGLALSVALLGAPRKATRERERFSPGPTWTTAYISSLWRKPLPRSRWSWCSMTSSRT